MFATSIAEIEALRADEMEALRQRLHLDRFPPGFDLSDPIICSHFCIPRLGRFAVFEAFPVKAEEIVNRYGLKSDELNKMLEDTRR